VDSQLRLDVGDLKLGGRRFAPADSLEGALADGGEVGREGDGGEGGTVEEGVAADGGEAGGKGNGEEGGAAVEGLHADGGELAGKVTERSEEQSRKAPSEAGGEGDGEEGGAAGEGAAGDGGEALGHSGVPLRCASIEGRTAQTLRGQSKEGDGGEGGALVDPEGER